MPTRIRVRDDKGAVYTVLSKTLPKTGKVKVRSAFGFVQEIPRRQLVQIPDDEPGSKLVYGDDAA